MSPIPVSPKVPSVFRQNLDILRCPTGDGGILSPVDDSVTCEHCQRRFQVDGDIPLLFVDNEWPDDAKDITRRMKAFYEDIPFPNYDDFDDSGTLVEKARKSIFPKLLDDQIPFGARIIECGCGTGQLTNFLAMANRHVTGTDMCVNSLKLGQEFKERNGIGRASFCQMNLFNPCFQPESFDVVISNGVLHHTSNPFLAFETISRLVKPGGFFIVGLYHRYGRIYTDLRRFIFRFTQDKFQWLDRRVLDRNLSEGKRKAWFHDQYKNPHESKHTIGETAKWLERIGFEFIKSIPKTRVFGSLSASERLFEAESLGNPLERNLVEIGQIGVGAREGGFFIVIGRKPE